MVAFRCLCVCRHAFTAVPFVLSVGIGFSKAKNASEGEGNTEEKMSELVKGYLVLVLVRAQQGRR